MSLSANFVTPFITRGISYRNDFTDTGSIIIDTPAVNMSNLSYFTDGDILTMQAQYSNPITFVAGTTVNGINNQTPQLSLSVNQGNIIIIMLTISGSSISVTSVTDSMSTGYGQFGSNNIVGTANIVTSVWTGSVTGSISDTITAHLTSATYSEINAVAYSNVNALVTPFSTVAGLSNTPNITSSLTTPGFRTTVGLFAQSGSNGNNGPSQLAGFGLLRTSGSSAIVPCNTAVVDSRGNLGGYPETGNILVAEQTANSSQYLAYAIDLLPSPSYGTATLTISLSGSPVTTPLLATRFKTGSNLVPGNDLQINVFSGSTSGSLLALSTGSFSFYSGSVPSQVNGYIDRVQLQLNASGSAGLTGSILTDFIQFYTENIPLRYINNSASYALKKRIIPQDIPMREQQVVQTLGSESPIVDLDGVFITDTDYTAQNYRDKLINLWAESNYQWLQLDFIGAKFIIQDPTINEIAGVPNYYKWSASFIQYTPTGATLQNYNLA
jgi:hypothetical protein